MNNSQKEKLKVNKRMIGQTVYVIEKNQHGWYGEVLDTVDFETFLIKDSKSQEQKEINIFDVRGCR